MRIAQIDFDHLLQLQVAQKTFVAVFLARWQQRNGNTYSITAQLVNTMQLPVDVIFFVWVNGNDDAEAYVVDELGMSVLPCAALFLHGAPNMITAHLNLESTLKQALADSVGKSNVMNLTNRSAVQAMLVGEKSASLLGRIFISGDRSSVGKSSVCLALLMNLVYRIGLSPADIAYIKPVTQCEAEQPVTRFCRRVGIAHCSIGPVVFYQGFTRAFLAGDTDPSSELIRQAVDAVEEVGIRKRIVVVDGVGYPSVGSICCISNAHVAQALHAPVLLVGKSGVGDAVDSYNLNSTFFESKGVRVLGGVFNKLSLEGFYSLERCKEAVTSFFTQYLPQQMPYGFMPLVQVDDAEDVGNDTNGEHACDTVDEISLSKFEQRLLNAFSAHVDVVRLLHDLWIYQMIKGSEHVNHAVNTNDEKPLIRMSDEAVIPLGMNERSITTARTGSRKRSREEVTEAAVKLGARAGS